MAPTLRPCPQCGRHIAASEARCPFCHHATPEGFGAFEYAAVGRRVTRAAIAAFGASLALAACASNQSVSDGGADVTQASDAVTQASDAGADVRPPPDVLPSPEDGGVGPPYGSPPRDE
jgi:hypothetical protein